MRIFKIFAAIFLSITLTACGGEKSKDIKRDQAIAKILANKTIVEDAGPAWLHENTGIAFPATVKHFKRMNITKLKNDGSDVSVYYESSGVGVVYITLYFTNEKYIVNSLAIEPNAENNNVESYITFAEKQILAHRKGKEKVEEGVLDITNEGHLKGPYSIFNTSNGESYTGVWVQYMDGWYVKARFTYSSHYRDTMSSMRSANSNMPPWLLDAGFNATTQLLRELDFTPLTSSVDSPIK